jgi:hypothetical protein
MSVTKEINTPVDIQSPDANFTAAFANLTMLRAFSRMMLPALASVLFLMVGMMVAAFVAVSRMNADKSSWPVILAIHLAQVGIGMTLGFVCLFLGMVMCWFGITGTFSIGAEGPGAKLNIQGAQVGIVLLVGGILLVALSLNKTVVGSRTFTEPLPSAQQTAQHNQLPASQSYGVTQQSYGIPPQQPSYGVSQSYGVQPSAPAPAR